MRSAFIAGLLLFTGCAPQIATGISVEGSPDGAVEVLTLDGSQISHTESQFLAAVNRKDDKLILVDFWATWCGPCKMMSPELEKVKLELGDKVEIVKLDVDKSRDVADHFNISGIPDVRIFRNGKSVSGFVGYSDADEILRKLRSLN
ncbi:MAG: thioredoxin [Planctomyces sp.]|nr:thioredoxin [Planctomyces sp.]